MNHEEFVNWLKGYFDASRNSKGEIVLDDYDVQKIESKLNTVYKENIVFPSTPGTYPTTPEWPQPWTVSYSDGVMKKELLKD